MLFRKSAILNSFLLLSAFSSSTTSVVAEKDGGLVCDNGQKLFEVSLTTDRFPDETSFEVTNDDLGAVVISEGNFTEFETIYDTMQYCLDVEASYTFTIYDSFSIHGDGICCDNGDGEYKIHLAGVLIGSGGEFGGSESHQFHTGTAYPTMSPSSSPTVAPSSSPTTSAPSSSPTFGAPSASPTTGVPTSSPTCGEISTSQVEDGKTYYIRQAGTTDVYLFMKGNSHDYKVLAVQATEADIADNNGYQYTVTGSAGGGGTRGGSNRFKLENTLRGKSLSLAVLEEEDNNQSWLVGSEPSYFSMQEGCNGYQMKSGSYYVEVTDRFNDGKADGKNGAQVTYTRNGSQSNEYEFEFIEVV